jgi:LysR family hydrogen peroxide-inducible transcriptional activator
VSQPTLSVAIKKLEDELGVLLFERGKQGVLVTPMGERIVKMAGGVLEQAAAIRDVAATDKDQLQGPLALGTSSTIGPYVLPQFIPLLRQASDQLSLYVEEDRLPALTTRLRSGELDVVLVAAPFSEPDIVSQALFDEPLVTLLPAGHRLAALQVITAADLDPAETLLLAEGDPFREQVLAAFPHLRPVVGAPAAQRPGICGSTIETLRHMVASRLGVTIVPQAAASVPLYSSQVLVSRPFAAPAPKRTLVLAWRASFPRHRAIDVLRRAIQASSAAYWNYSTMREMGAAGLLVANREW